MQETPVVNNIIFLWKYLGEKRRYQFILLLILMIVSVFAEVISIGSVVPFLSALTNPEVLMQLDWFQPIIHMLDIKSTNELLLPLTLGFVGASIFAAGIRILLLWVNTHLSASMGIQLRSEVYARTLYQPYAFHIANNSSQLISMVTEKVGLTILSGIMHVLMLVSAAITSLAIIATLILINPMVALLTFLILGGGYILMGYLVRKHIKSNGDIIAKNQPDAVKCMQEGLGGIRDIILDSNQNIFIQLYTKVAKNIQLAGMKNAFLGGLPKSLLEVLSIILIAILAYSMQVGGNQEEQVLPILGALALGAQRLLPALQQIYFSWSMINGNQKIIAEVVTQLKQSTPQTIIDEKPTNILNFHHNIVLENVGFKYQNSDIHVLEDINLDIQKGSRIGFIGTTGSGKSTLLDIMMGLLLPSHGQFKIDGVKIDKNNISNWQSNIAHVPQSIFLSDASMAENIAFGVEIDNIDMSKVKKVSELACLDTFIEELPNGYQTSVGERGVQLSGGQRQRIGIARALYKQANVIILDEATSALDDITELNIMQNIDSLEESTTVLMIAHRVTTLKGCTQIYRLDKGTIVEYGSYEEIINAN